MSLPDELAIGASGSRRLRDSRRVVPRRCGDGDRPDSDAGGGRESENGLQ